MRPPPLLLQLLQPLLPQLQLLRSVPQVTWCHSMLQLLLPQQRQKQLG
jgi:hypothetical protein